MNILVVLVTHFFANKVLGKGRKRVYVYAYEKEDVVFVCECFEGESSF